MTRRSASHRRQVMWVAAAGAVSIAAVLGLASRPALDAATGRQARDGAARVLRVCADPNNLPYSNKREEGFENRLAALVARDLHARLAYVWWAQRRGFFRNTLKAGLCDAVMGVPKGLDMALTTSPYYRSTYVFVSRRERGLHLASLGDPRLRDLRIGVQLVGDDGANTPPVHALGARGIVQNVVGYTVYGNYSDPNPAARIVDAVARGEVDTAVVWGPFAGYFAARSKVPLEVTPVAGTTGQPAARLSFAIAVGVRKGDTGLRDEIERVLDRRRGDVQALLARYQVPLAAEAPGGGGPR